MLGLYNIINVTSGSNYVHPEVTHKEPSAIKAISVTIIAM